MNTEIYKPDWPLPEGVQACFTGRQGGGSQPPFNSFNLALHVGDNAQIVQQNRRLLLSHLFGARDVQWLNQVHGNDIVEACGGSVTLNADAVTTTRSGLACAVMTADCLPVLFCDLDGHRVAAAHAGWRGLASGILLNTLHTFDNPSRVSVYLAPAIGADAFEVGPEVRSAFSWASSNCFRVGQGDRFFADIYQLARVQLGAAGVQHIYGGDACTFTESERFFSYRRDGQTGRQVSLIWKS